MTEEKKTTTEEKVVDTQNETPKTEKKEVKKNFQKNEKRPFKKNFKKRIFRREKPEFEQKILSLRRVTRVMAGGRRFSFSVAMVVGDKKNRVGVGLGKANDVVASIEKAVRNAKKNMVKVKLTDNFSIPFDIEAKYKSSEIKIRPIVGKGLAAGGAVRVVLEFAGIKEAGAKILSRSKNHLNNARATIIALEPISERFIVDDTKKRIMNKKRINNNFKKNKTNFNTNYSLEKK